MKAKLIHLDRKVLHFVNDKCRTKFLDKAMPRITAIGDSGIVWLALVVILFCMSRYRVQSLKLFFSITLTTIVGEGIIKNIIKRQRPYILLGDCKLLIEKPITYSFPSGHTASSFAVVGSFMKAHNAPHMLFIIIILTIIAILIAISRIYLNVHYFTDVICGIILGIICSNIIVEIFNSYIIR